jgi:hypothetical protein
MKSVLASGAVVATGLVIEQQGVEVGPLLVALSAKGTGCWLHASVSSMKSRDFCRGMHALHTANRATHKLWTCSGQLIFHAVVLAGKKLLCLQAPRTPSAAFIQCVFRPCLQPLAFALLLLLLLLLLPLRTPKPCREVVRILPTLKAKRDMQCYHVCFICVFKVLHLLCCCCATALLPLRTPKPCVARWCASCARSRPSVT